MSNLFKIVVDSFISLITNPSIDLAVISDSDEFMNGEMSISDMMRLRKLSIGYRDQIHKFMEENSDYFVASGDFDNYRTLQKLKRLHELYIRLTDILCKRRNSYN